MRKLLLGVDLGLTGGLAIYDDRGVLVRVRSFHFANVGALKRALPSLMPLMPEGELAHVFVEGDKHLGDLFGKAAARQGAELHRVAPETWRARLLKPREQRDAKSAKASAERRAREVIEALAEKRPTSLRVDAAEAILIGLFGLLVVGWRTEPSAR